MESGDHGKFHVVDNCKAGQTCGDNGGAHWLSVGSLFVSPRAMRVAPVNNQRLCCSVVDPQLYKALSHEYWDRVDQATGFSSLL